jgi:intraflagellar transport protein 74
MEPSVGLTASASLNIDARPVTQQGLTGMRTRPLGPGRQIADKNYYLTDLRLRITDITNEIASLHKEEETTHTDNEKYVLYERKHEEMIKEVRTLEGELADFNLALDKVRANTPVADINSQFNNLKTKNDKERKKVDSVFLKSKTHEKRTKEIHGQMDMIMEQASERMKELGEEVFEEYEELTDENQALLQEITERETHIGELDLRITQMNSSMKTPEYQTHMRGVNAQKRLRLLEKLNRELEEETTSQLTPEEMRDKLLQKVKDANAEIGAHERRVKQVEDQLEAYHDLIAEKEQELAEAKKHSLKAKKYETVYERDRKMQEVIEAFPASIKGEQANVQKLKDTVVALLKHMSKNITSAENLPNAEKLADMKNELSFKEQTLANSKTTLQALEKDLSKSREELSKIESLDTKINAELKLLKDKMQKYAAEMKTFKSEDELKEEATQAKKRLLKEKAETRKLRDAVKQQVQLAGVAFDKKKRELASNDTMKKLDGLEQKLRTYSQTVFTLDDYITTRKRESDFKGVAAEARAITSKINTYIIEKNGK